MESKEALAEEIENCPTCGNIYQVVHHKPGDDWNDFGCRFCPFCGVPFQEHAFTDHTCVFQ